MNKLCAFSAAEKPFTLTLESACVSAYSIGDKSAAFYRPIPIKKGDTFSAAPRGILLNGKLLERKARPLKKIVYKVSWVASRMRVAVFQERDRIWNKRTRKPTKRFGKPYWTACDLRSYHVGCADTIPQAIRNLIRQVQATNLIAEEERLKGHRVIRWRCLLDPKEAKEFEAKAKKTGFILDGVETPPLPKEWQAGLLKLARKAKD